MHNIYNSVDELSPGFTHAVLLLGLFHRRFKHTCRYPLVEAADMTSVDLGSLMSDLVAAKKRMREKGTMCIIALN